jgi:hypothetical protein
MRVLLDVFLRLKELEAHQRIPVPFLYILHLSVQSCYHVQKLFDKFIILELQTVNKGFFGHLQGVLQNVLSVVGDLAFEQHQTDLGLEEVELLLVYVGAQMHLTADF